MRNAICRMQNDLLETPTGSGGCSFCIKKTTGSAGGSKKL